MKSYRAIPAAAVLLLIVFAADPTPMAGAQASPPAAADAGLLGVEDMLDTVTLRLADLSNDGRWLAVAASTQRDRIGIDNYALRRLGKEVAWVQYINGGHGMPTSSLEEVRDYHKQIVGWFDSHLKGDLKKDKP